MANLYPNGAGGTLGDSWATCHPLYMSGAIWYVSSLIGTNAASPAGRNREKPLATLAQAITNASDNDVVVCLSGHVETLTAADTISKKLTIVGEGLSAGLPTVVFTCGWSGNLFSITAANVELRNLLIAASSVANASTKITCNQTDFVMDGCYVQCGPNDAAANLTLASGADRCRLRNTTFISTATSTAAQPESAIKTSAAIADLELDGLVLSAGTVGFSNYFALDASTAAVTRLRGLNVSLLLGADVNLHASTTGRLNVQSVSGGSRVQW